MTRERAFFLQAMGDHLNGRETAAPETALDWEALLSIAKIHQVGGILYHQCMAILPPEYAVRLREQYGAALYYHTNRTAMAAALEEALQAEGIPFFVIKGSAVAAYYPVPALRTMGDTDLVIHTEDRMRAHEILLSQGFVNESHFADREWVYYKNRMEFELHDHLVYRETVNRPEHETYFNDFWQYVHDGQLDWSFHFLFLLLHLRKHLMNEGVGFRQFMDVAVVAKNAPGLDWNWIGQELGALGFLDFARNVFAMNEAWFGLKTPISANTPDADFFETATDVVFRNGIFGFDNADNRANRAVNIARSAENAHLAMTKSAIRKVFPSYQTLITVPHYRFLEGKPWLLPAAWVYRMLRGLSGNRFRRSVRHVGESFTSKETVEERGAFLDRWGL